MLVVIKVPKTNFKTPLGNTIQVINAFFNKPPVKTVYGYIPYWMLANSKYIQYDKLTDISYFGLWVDEDGNFVTNDKDGNLDPSFGAWKNDKRLTELIGKAKMWKVRPSLTLVLQKDDAIDKFLACKACWSTLSTNAIAELKKKGIKDISIDFEHSGEASTEIRDKYSEFIEYMKIQMDQNFEDSRITVAVFADSFRRTRVTDPVKLSRSADALFIMAYDYHHPSSDTAGPVAPLFGAPVEYNFDVSTAILEFKDKISPNKLILGVAYYGYNFPITTESEKSTVITDASDEETMAQYYAMIMQSNAIPLSTSKFDTISKTPYILYKSRAGIFRVLHYENAKSLQYKYDFIKSENLLGVGIWALGYDGEYKELWNLLQTNFKE